MAGIAEISIGLATVLGASPTPEPLYVELRGQTVSEAVLLIRRVIDECSDGDIKLSLVIAVNRRRTGTPFRRPIGTPLFCWRGGCPGSP